MISSILLAAGQSKRMVDENKLIKKFNNKLLINYILRSLIKSKVKKIIIVVGYQYKKLINSVKPNKKTIFVINKNYKLGISSSIKCGLKKLNRKDEGFLVVLADMPFISKSIINKMCNTISSNRKSEIFLPIHKGKTGNPIGFKTSFIKKLKKISGDGGAKRIIKLNKKKTEYIKANSKSIFVDFDKKKDFQV